MKSFDNDGIRKAAILVDCLDQRAADGLLEQMAPDEARLVRRAMVELGTVDPAEQRRVIDEFLRVAPMVPDKEPPGIELDGRFAGQLVREADLAKGSQACRREPDEPPAEGLGRQRPFHLLRDAEADKLARILDGERPQTIALVLSHLPSEQAGAVLVRFSAQVQADVLRRLVDLEETSPEILREVERALESRLSEHVQMQRRRVAGLEAVAGILEAASRRTGTDILDNLAAHDPRLADRLGPEPLPFEGLVRLDEASLGAVLRAADRRLVVLALVGAPPELAEHFLERLPGAEAALVRREILQPGPTRLDDVSEARRRIAALARQMAARQEINWPGAAGTFAFPEALQAAA